MSAERIRELEHIIACHQTADATAREDIERLQAFVESRGLWEDFRAFGVKQMREWQATASEALSAKTSAAKAQTSVSNRTDLFKALNNFMAVLAAYAPGSHRDAVVLELGDTAFRAFERALDDSHLSRRRLVPEKPAGPFEIEWNGEAGRVVIRKRQPSVSDLASINAKAMDDLKTYSARQSREAQLEREKANAKNRERQASTGPCMATEYQRGTCLLQWGHSGPHDFGDDYVPQLTRPEAEKAMTDLSGINSVVRGTPPEETKPPANPCRYATPGCTAEARCALCQTDAARDQRNAIPPARAHLKECVLNYPHVGDCTIRRDANAPEPKSPALSPRQALGEALACVERARDLFLNVASDPTVDKDVRLAALNGYQSAMNAWGSATSARALLAQQEKKQ